MHFHGSFTYKTVSLSNLEGSPRYKFDKIVNSFCRCQPTLEDLIVNKQ